MTHYLEFAILLTIVVFLLYKWSVAKYHILQERGVPHDKPFPFIGSMSLSVLLGKTSFLKSIINGYTTYKNSKVYGAYQMRDCHIYVRDLDLIKKIGIKDFDIFPNRKAMVLDEGNIYISKTLIALKDKKWRTMRNSLSPSFTGSKMRSMFHLVNECVLEALNYLSSEVQAAAKPEIEIEMKNFSTRFTNDAIASTAFGINVNSFKDENNEFLRTGKAFTEYTGFTLLKAFLCGLVPKITKFLRIQIIDESIFNYFNRLVTGAIEYRKQHKIIRPDMINLLLEAKKHFEENKASLEEEHAEISDEDLLAQCIIFFIAGFDTVSACLCFTAHELLDNSDVQDRLYDEILETQKALEGQALSYDSLMKMTYMDTVISESLRKWPPVVFTERLCTADYDLKDEEGNLVLEIKKGDNVFVPIIGLHHDPLYYRNTDMFDPERFSDENKSEIEPMTYLPFGLGPRMCIGNRLALMEIKALMYHIILNYKIVRSEKTCKDLMSSIKGFKLVPEEGFWMKLVKRD